MTETEAVKLCVVLIPMVTMAVTALIAGFAEWLENRNSVDLAKTEEGKKLIAYMTEE